jgi:hypothetical protein
MRVQQALLAAGKRATGGVAEAGPGIDRRTLFRHAYVALLAADRFGAPSVRVYSPELEHRYGGPEPQVEIVEG